MKTKPVNYGARWRGLYTKTLMEVNVLSIANMMEEWRKERNVWVLFVRGGLKKELVATAG